MRFVPINLVQDGMIIGKTIYNDKGIPLLHKGTSLNKLYINKLILLGYQGLIVDDEISKYVDYEENFVSQELKFIISKKLQSSFAKIINGKQTSSIEINELKNLIDEVINNMLNSKELTLNLLELKMYDNYTYFHSINVAIISLVLGYHFGLNISDLKGLGLAALLHDIGKVFISSDILNKPGSLTPEEYEIIKTHSIRGYETCKNNPNINNKISIAILNHHEHFDGTGYPNNFDTDKISLWGRIICIADVYDALTSDRPYRKAYEHSNAIEYIMGNSGVLFDPQLVNLFLAKVYPYPAGSIIELSNGKKALVLDNNAICLRPIIKILDDNITVDLYNDPSFRSITIKRLLTE